MRSAVFIMNRDFLGSMLVHLPLLHALKQAEEKSEVIVFAPFESARFFKNIGAADDVIIYSYDPLGIRKHLKQIRADLVLSLRPQSQWLDLVIGFSRISQRIGFKTFLSRALFTHTAVNDDSIYRAENILRLPALIGISGSLEDYFRELKNRADIKLPQNRYCISLFLGGGAGKWKHWGIDNYMELCRRLKKRHEHAYFLFILGEEVGDYVDRIRSDPLSEDSRILMTESFPNLAAAVHSARIAIANDCGQAHVAQMMKIPYVGIFSDHDGRGSQLAAEWFLSHERSLAVISEPGKDIKDIPVELVENAVRRLLK